MAKKERKKQSHKYYVGFYKHISYKNRITIQASSESEANDIAHQMIRKFADQNSTWDEVLDEENENILPSVMSRQFNEIFENQQGENVILDTFESILKRSAQGGT